MSMTLHIDAWLHGIGLAQYGELFRSNDIDGAMLRQLSADDLKELGVASLGHRKKLLEAIAALDAASESLAAAPAAPAAGSTAERRQLTVMFVDLVGSTALSAQFDPEDMSELIRSYQNTVAGEISRFEGTLRSSSATACWLTLGGRERMKTTPSVQCGLRWLSPPRPHA